jgi:glutaredoxin
LKAHHYIDVKKDAGKLDEMLKLSNGKREVPVIVEDAKVTIGFGGGT